MIDTQSNVSNLLAGASFKTLFKEQLMKKPKFVKKYMLYLYTNGYSDPGGQGSIRWFLKMPTRMWRIVSVLRGIWFDRRFDRKHNVSTTGAIFLKDLEIDSSNVELGELYDPFPSGPLKRLLSMLPQVDLSETTFVDFGSGKGRVLLIASDHPFKQILGVEFSPELHEQAENNIRSFRSRQQKCETIESLCQDATEFAIPDGPCVFFIFAAFRGEAFIEVLKNIKESYHESPRPMHLLYVTDPLTHPIPDDDIQSVPLFRNIRSGRFAFDLSQRYPLGYSIFEAEKTTSGH
ncbi:MAG: class I SAM-dependent methyltransferase [Planctomycetaceae bacterium]|nr:class I SAM-dependent methyltransferase [Planctomycetaceae bacterium]MCP4479792.1 class I SAM-dependent methyltransferase [Planctomycetaceae bacterium]MCP4776488.1 class I SAM-dependent methyltransferase [Planctomycetaceae bacterium]